MHDSSSLLALLLVFPFLSADSYNRAICHSLSLASHLPAFPLPLPLSVHPPSSPPPPLPFLPSSSSPPPSPLLLLPSSFSPPPSSSSSLLIILPRNYARGSTAPMPTQPSSCTPLPETSQDSNQSIKKHKYFYKLIIKTRSYFWVGWQGPKFTYVYIINQDPATSSQCLRRHPASCPTS